MPALFLLTLAIFPIETLLEVAIFPNETLFEPNILHSAISFAPGWVPLPIGPLKVIDTVDNHPVL